MDEPCSGILRVSTEMILTSLLATHASILTCIKSTFAFASASSLIQRSSTIDREFKSRHKVWFVNTYQVILSYAVSVIIEFFTLILVFYF